MKLLDNLDINKNQKKMEKNQKKMENFEKFLPTHVSVNWSSFDEMLKRAECPAKFLPNHVSVNWSSFDEMLKRAECPLFHRPEFCERCDGYAPVCPRVDMRPVRIVDPISEYITEYMRSISINN